MRFPWISREHHEEVVCAKDELIRSLEVQIAILTNRLSSPAPIDLTVKLPEDFAVIQPAMIRGARRRPQQEADKPKDDPAIDWARIDENDNEAIALIAAKELGGPVDAFTLSTVVTRIKANIRQAKAQKRRRTVEEGNLAATAPPPPQKPEAEQQVPLHIQRLIENAEKGQ